jgi:hypothetical protein
MLPLLFLGAGLFGLYLYNQHRTLGATTGSAPYQPGQPPLVIQPVQPGQKVIFTLAAPSTYKAGDVGQVLYSFGWTASAITGDTGRFNATTRRTGPAILMPRTIGLLQVLRAVVS